MLQSLKLSNLILRFGLALLFFWFGIDKFTHPQYWVGAWLTPGFLVLIEKFGLTGANLVYLVGIIQVLVGVSLVSGLLIRFFSVVAICLLFFTLVHGFNEIFLRDLALIGAFIALITWPDRHLA